MAVPTTPPTVTIGRFSVWIGDIVDTATYPIIGHLHTRFPATPSTRTTIHQAAIFTRGHGHEQRGIGYLHARFVPNQTEELAITVASGPDNGDGLDADYGGRVRDALQFVLQDPQASRLGAGQLTVDRALAHLVDSTLQGFTVLGLYLGVLFAPDLDYTSRDAVQAAWEQCMRAWRERPSP